MSNPQDHDRDRHDRRRGLAAVGVAVLAVLIGLTAGITSSSSPAAANGAAAWIQRERPAGAVLTVEGWEGVIADGDRLRVVNVDEEQLLDLAVTLDPGSIVLPPGAPAADVLREDDGWSVAYRDESAIVFVHEGALPVPGST